MHMEKLRLLELTQLRLVEALADRGSVSAAAESLGLSQSAASHALARLRGLFDDPLFVRTSRGMEPTAAGERVAAAVRQAMAALREGLDAAGPFEPARSDRVFKVYMSDIAQMVFLPRLLAHLKATAPGIRLRACPIPLRSQEAALESGEIDLAIGHFTSLTTGFYQRRLFREKYVCIVRSGHPRFARGMSVEAFRQAEHGYADSSGIAHEQVEKVLAQHGIPRRLGLTVPQFMVLPLVIAGSDLVVTMPSRLAEAFARLIPIQVPPFPVRIPAFDIKLFWHQRAHKDAANKWLRDCFVRLFAA
jgi:DNA-binding transcriptional LysR family regulator